MSIQTPNLLMRLLTISTSACRFPSARDSDRGEQGAGAAGEGAGPVFAEGFGRGDGIVLQRSGCCPLDTEWDC